MPTQALPLSTLPPRRMSRGWVIVGLALGAWLAVLVAGYALWSVLF